MARPSARFLLARKQDYLLVALKSQGDRKGAPLAVALERAICDLLTSW